MKEQLERIKQDALAALANAKEAADLENLRVKYLGKKGELTAVLKQMGKLTAEERPVIGQLANEVREKLAAEIDSQKKKIEEIKLQARLEAEAVDVTIPGIEKRMGHKHPMYAVLDEIKEIKRKQKLSVIFITHDLGVVANMADRICVMYAGRIVEVGTCEDIFYRPAHPYTWALLSAMPDLHTEETLFAIPGIGYISYNAMVAGDIPFSMFYMTFLAILTLLGNLISDILYAVVDPRVRIA